MAIVSTYLFVIILNMNGLNSIKRHRVADRLKKISSYMLSIRNYTYFKNILFERETEKEGLSISTSMREGQGEEGEADTPLSRELDNVGSIPGS